MSGMVGGFNKKIWLDLMKIWLRLGDTVDIINISMGNLSTNKIEESALEENETTGNHCGISWETMGNQFIKQRIVN